MSALTLEFAQSRYRIEGLDADRIRLVRARFGALECDPRANSDVTVVVSKSDSPEKFMARPDGPVEYRIGLRYAEDQVQVEGIEFSARIERGTLRTTMDSSADDDWFTDGFENLFRVVAAYRLFARGSLVMHSAAFADGARGFLCCGRSGAGKTTLSTLVDGLGLEVLSDELNAVVIGDDKVALQPMPFAGDFGRVRVGDERVPLARLLGLRHGTSARVDPCSRAEAVSRIVASCPYVNGDPLLVDAVTDRAAQLVRRIPLELLTFAKDDQFWEILANAPTRPPVPN